LAVIAEAVLLADSPEEVEVSAEVAADSVALAAECQAVVAPAEAGKSSKFEVPNSKFVLLGTRIPAARLPFNNYQRILLKSLIVNQQSLIIERHSK
jgi:hypothetical protein